MVVFKKSSFFLMLLCIFLGTLYISPKIEKFINNKKSKIITENCNVFSNAILSKYNSNKKINVENTAKDLAEEFNKKYTNPINKKEQAFTFDNKIKGACNITYDKTVKALDITGLDSDEAIVIRLVVKPPSFVRYDRD